jgi:precorrin-6B methylase 2
LPCTEILDLEKNLFEERTKKFILDVGAALGSFVTDLLGVVPNEGVYALNRSQNIRIA